MSLISFKDNYYFDLVSIGRLCIDLNANEINRPMEETSTFKKYVGGSPANITIGAAKLGLSTGFIGKVSDDQMGRFIINYFNKCNINTDEIKIDQTGAVTGLAFTEIKSPQECSILMYRDNVADLLLSPTEVNEDYIKKSRVLLISGTALASSPSREAVFLALDYAIKHDVRVVFDLDYRPYTWASDEETAVYYNLAAEKCDVIIGTREEFDMMERLVDIHQYDDAYTAAKWFSYRAKIVVIKHGQDGSFAYTKDGQSVRSGIFPTNVIKTFGAGDAYASSFIYALLTNQDIPEAMKMGSASASIVISSHSSSESMPTESELLQFIKNRKYILK